MINAEIARRNFHLACQEYEKAKSIIREMSNWVQSADSSFSFETAMGEFDLILQAIMLRTAAEDGYFLDEEEQFIEKLTDYADLMSYLCKKHDVNVSWSSFRRLSTQEQKDISLKVLVDIDNIVTKFVTPFAVVDHILPKDYCEELTHCMQMICGLLAGCDGDNTESEVFRNEMIVSFALIEKTLKEKWGNVDRIASEKDGHKTSAQTKAVSGGNSLKEIYLKKKT